VQVRDLDRTFDPINQNSPYFQGLAPRQTLQIKANNEELFTGIIADFDYDYKYKTNTNDVGMLTISGVDNFDLLGKTYIAQTTPSAQLSGARINSVLAYPEIDYDQPTNISTGSSTLGAYQISDNTSTIDYLQQIAQSEQGYVFISRNGTLTYKGRNDVLSVTTAATFADSGNYPLYDSVNAVFGAEQLYNRAVIARPGGTDQVSIDQESINAFGLSTFINTENLVSTDLQAKDIADYIVSVFGQPDLRFSDITVGVRGSATNDTKVLELDVADTISVIKNFATGSPTSRTETVAIEGIAHQFTRDRHTVTLNLGKIDGRAFLRLDDATYGVLDQNLLGF
jgi:hypothetical protein